MNLDLSGKTALVCGGSKGIGLAIAQSLDEMGARCVLVGRTDEALQSACASLKNKPEHYSSDLSEAMARAGLIKYLRDQKIHVDILINNAGGPPTSSFTEAKSADMTMALQGHLFAMDELSRALIPAMAEKGFGRIVNIVSVTARVPLPNLLLSNVVRGAVLSWAKTV